MKVRNCSKIRCRSSIIVYDTSTLEVPSTIGALLSEPYRHSQQIVSLLGPMTHGFFHVDTVFPAGAVLDGVREILVLAPTMMNLMLPILVVDVVEQGEEVVPLGGSQTEATTHLGELCLAEHPSGGNTAGRWTFHIRPLLSAGIGKLPIIRLTRPDGCSIPEINMHALFASYRACLVLTIGDKAAACASEPKGKTNTPWRTPRRFPTRTPGQP